MFNQCILEEDDATAVVDCHSCALFTLDTLVSTSNGVTSPIIVTFFFSISMLNDLTPTQYYNTISPKQFAFTIQNYVLITINPPSIFEICFLIFPSQALQCNDTLRTTTCRFQIDQTLSYVGRHRHRYLDTDNNFQKPMSISTFHNYMYCNNVNFQEKTENKNLFLGGDS